MDFNYFKWIILLQIDIGKKFQMNFQISIYPLKIKVEGTKCL